MCSPAQRNNITSSLLNFYYSGRSAARMCQAHRCPGSNGRPVPTRAAAHLHCVFLLAVLASCACLVDAGQAALPTSSGGRRLLACDPFDLQVRNDCKEPIEAAVVAQLSQDVAPGFCNNTATKAGEWCTRLWYQLAANESVTPFTSLTLAEAYVYARPTSIDGFFWRGQVDDPATRWFSIDTGEPCEALSSSHCKPFGQSTSSSCPNPIWLADAFECSACDLFFTNNCSLPAQLAFYNKLLDDVAPGFCAGPAHKRADWCVRSGFTLAPGETSSQALAQVYFNAVWYWASATDASNRTVDWTDEADEETGYRDLQTGDRCRKEDAATCKPFQRARCGNITLSCPALPNCTIPHCQTYTPDGPGCACGTCEPGYSGSQCTACAVSNCLSYLSSSECYCDQCAVGYKTSSGSCTGCNVSNCLSYSSQCSCRECAVGYRASGGSCVACSSPSSSDPHCKSYGSVCSCATCSAGYRLTSYNTCSACGITCSLYADSGECACQQQCQPGWQLSGSGACFETKSNSPSTAVIAGAAVGAAAAVAVAVGAAVFLVRRRRHKRTQAPPGDGGEKGALDSVTLPPGGVPHSPDWGSGSGSGGAGDPPSIPTAPHSSPPPSQLSAAPAQQWWGAAADAELAGAVDSTAASEASELATLPPVQEDLADGPLATFPTRPAGLPPASLASLQAGLVTAATPGLGSQPSTAGNRAAAAPQPCARSAGSAARSPLHSASSSPHSPGASSGPSPRSSLLVPPGAGSEAPSTPAAPSRAGTASLTSASMSSSELLSHDPLISYFQSQLPPSPGAPAALQGRRGSQGGVELRPWEVRFSDLVFRKPVGEGSYGRVYLAEWAATQVAVKVLIGGQLASSGEVQRALALSAPIQQKLEQEASLLASLRHPNVVNFMAICREPPCIVTEYCARGSLAEVLAAARTDPAVAAQLTWLRRLAMAADAAAGMLYVHTRPSPIVHRDLKSPNLLVDDSWHCKVSDLNLSKILEDTTHSSSMAAMNPRWLAPELMRGQRATPASDVFSFGVVLHELLTWQLPWGAANPWLVVSRVLAGGRLEVPPREALPGPDTPGWAGLDGYVALMQHCWAQAPESRPSFQDIVVALRELMEQAGGTTV